MSPKLRFKVENQEFEAEGTEEEIVSLYNKVRQNIEGYKIEATASLSSSFTVETKEEELARRMPTVEQLISFILSKPKYEHDIVEVENHFLKRRITSRENETLYRKFSFDLQKARKVIEAQKVGTFEQQTTLSKNLKKYVFQPMSHSLTEIFTKPS
jgi:hypothetical protein